MPDDEPKQKLDQPKATQRFLVLRWLDEFEYIVSALALLGLVGMLTVSILARYIGGYSVPWSEEVARFMFVAVIFASISYAARQHRHIRITMFVEKMLGRRTRFALFMLGDVIWLLMNVVVLYGSYIIIADMFRYPFNSAVLNIPMYFVYMIIPVFFLTLSIRIIQGMFLRMNDADFDTHSGEQI